MTEITGLMDFGSCAVLGRDYRFLFPMTEPEGVLNMKRLVYQISLGNREVMTWDSLKLCNTALHWQYGLVTGGRPALVTLPLEIQAFTRLEESLAPRDLLGSEAEKARIDEAERYLLTCLHTVLVMAGGPNGGQGLRPAKRQKTE